MANYAIYKDTLASIINPIGPKPSLQCVSVVGATDSPLVISGNVNIVNPLGQQTSANSIPVVVSSNQSDVGVIVNNTNLDPVNTLVTNSNINPVNVEIQTIGTAYDPFGRFRISQNYTLFDSKFLSDNQPLFWDDSQTVGGGTSSTYNTNQASVTLAVSNATLGTRVRQTYQRFNYQSGKAQLILITGNFGSGNSGITKQWGYYDDSNGLFFQISGTTLNICIRSNTSGTPVDTLIPQSSWNVDKLDGTGPSGINLDTSKTNIYVINFQWLGVGNVYFGIFFGTKLIVCHMIQNENINTVVYMSTPNLPLRIEISNNGTGPVSSLTQICSQVASESG